MKNKILSIMLTGLLLSGVVVLFSACENFMVDAVSFKDQLKEEVLVAGAEEVEITIQAQTGTGTTSPNGLTTVKLGVAFNVLLQEDEDYGFIRWATYRTSDPATEVTGLVSFADPESASTKATLLSSSQDILIQPVCERRPYVWGKEPGGLFTEVVRNYPITIQFNKEIDPASVSFDNIEILGKLNGSYTDPVSVENNFAAPVVSGRYVTISVNSAIEAGWVINVTLDGTIADTSGLTMNNEYNWQYLVNSSTDTSSPLINSVSAGTGLTAGGVITYPASVETHRTGNSAENLYLAIDASDSSGVQNLFITETQIYDNMGNATNVVYPQTILAYSSANSFEYTLKCPDDGIIRLDIYVTDVNGNTSTESSYTVIQDTTPPDGPANGAKIVNPAAAGGYHSKQLNYTLSSALSDVGVDGFPAPYRTRSSIVEWAFSFNDGADNWTDYDTWLDSSSGTAITVPVTVADGSVDVRVKFRDDQNNESPYVTLDSINIDATSPLISLADIQNSITTISTVDYITSTTISLQITGSDNPGSGVSHYLLKRNNTAAPSVSDAGWLAVTSPGGVINETHEYLNAPQGATTLSVWLKDQAGNISLKKDSIDVIVDSQGPETPAVSHSTENDYKDPDTSIYYTADSITFTPTATDSGVGTLKGFSNNGADSTTEIAAGTTFPVSTTSNIILYAVDILNNISTGSLNLTVKKDTTAPSCASANRSVSGTNNYRIHNSGSTNYYHYNEAKLTFTADDGVDGSGVKEFALTTSTSTPSSWTAYTGANMVAVLPDISTPAKSLYLHLRDNVGNANYIDIGDGNKWLSDVTRPDQPVISAASFDYNSGSTYYYNEISGNANVNFSSADTGSGLAGYVNSSGTPEGSLNLIPGDFSNIYAVDNVGNYSVNPADSFTIVRDATNPDKPSVVTSSLDSSKYFYKSANSTLFYNFTPLTSVDVEFYSDDGTGSGVRGFRTDNNLTTPYDTTLTLSNSSNSIYAFDNVDNISAPLALPLEMDMTGPATPTVIDGAGFYDMATNIYYTLNSSSINVSFSSTDTGSGLKGFYRDGDSGTVSMSLTLSVNNTDKVIYAVDQLDNPSAVALTIDEVKRDNTAPSAPTITNVDGLGYYDSVSRIYYTTSGSPASIILDSTDAGSGLKGFSLTNDGTGVSPSPLSVPLSNMSQNIYALDQLNNDSSALVVTKVMQDLVPPTTTLGTAMVCDATSISGFETTDAGVGLKGSNYSSTKGSFDGSNITGLSAMAVPVLTPYTTETITIQADDLLNNRSNITITRRYDGSNYSVVIP